MSDHTTDEAAPVRLIDDLLWPPLNDAWRPRPKLTVAALAAPFEYLMPRPIGTQKSTSAAVNCPVIDTLVRRVSSRDNRSYLRR